MTPMPLGHTGRPPEPHDVWTAWSADPLLWIVLALTVVLYARGRSSQWPLEWRLLAFAGALLGSVVAFLSPLEAMARSLAAAHMVQHVVLVLAVAPLVVIARPAAILMRGLPAASRKVLAVAMRGSTPVRRLLEPLSSPAAAWLLHVGALWFWHAAGPYEAALRHDGVHLLEHVTMLLTGVMVWRHIVGPRARRREGAAVLLLFGLAVQSVLLSALLTFASSPWYESYVATAPDWGLSAMTDQHLAGLLMWVPSGLVHVVVAVRLVMALVDPQPTAGATVSLHRHVQRP